MTGVSVTSNVRSSVTATPTRLGTCVNDREHINSTPTGLSSNVTDTKDRNSVTSTPTGVGDNVIETKDSTVPANPTGMGNNVTDTVTTTHTDDTPSANVVENNVTITPPGVGSENVDNTVGENQDSEAGVLQLEQVVTSSTDKYETASGHQLENDVSTSQDEATPKSHDPLVGVAYDVGSTAPPLLEALVPGNHSNFFCVVFH